MSDEKKTLFGVGVPAILPKKPAEHAADDDAAQGADDKPQDKPKSVKSKLAELAVPGKPKSTAPKSTAPKSTAPKSTAPKSVAPTGSSTAPMGSASRVPSSPGATTQPDEAQMAEAAEAATAPESAAPESAPPESVAPKSVAPKSVAPKSVAPKSVAPKSVAPENQQIVKPSGFPTVDDGAKTIVPGMHNAAAMMVNPQPGAADGDQAKTIVPGAMQAHPGADDASKRDMMAAAVGLPPPPEAPQNIDDMAKTLVPGMMVAPGLPEQPAPAAERPLADTPTTPSGEVALPPMQAGHVAGGDVGFARTIAPGSMAAPAQAQPAQPAQPVQPAQPMQPVQPAQVPADLLTTGARRAPVAVPIATPPTDAGVASASTAPGVGAAAQAPQSAPPAAMAHGPSVGRIATPAPADAGGARPASYGQTGPEMPAVNAPATAPAQPQGLAAGRSEQMVIGSAATERSGIDGLSLHEGEHLVSVEKPGAFFWGLFVMFMLLVITIPIALWMLLSATGRVYVITNRRSIKVGRGGKITELPHDQLERFVVSGFMGASNVSLKLLPKKGSGLSPLTFGLCGPMGAMARLWGVIYFWVLGEHVSIDDAPPVDAAGKLSLTEHALDIAIFDNTMYRKGVNLSQMQMRGATVFTPTRVIWLREQDYGTDGKVHATMPVYGFLQSVAQRSASAEAFEAEIERVARGGGLAEVMSREWSTLSDFKYGKLKGLSYVDGKDQKRAHIVIPGRYEQALEAYLGKLGINPS